MDEDDAFMVGDGSGKPTGILPSQTYPTTFSPQKVGTGDADDITWDGLKALPRGLYAQYRRNCVFVSNSQTAGEAERLKDGESRNYIRDAIVPGQKVPELGVRWFESEAMPNAASASYPIICGDFSGYCIAERLGMSIQRYNDSNTGINVVEFHIRRRLGGHVIEPYKFAVQQCNATLGNL
jgi:HK97 family phage major capsid protein